MKTIDLNCDLGEWKDKDGALKDSAIMPFITSCNIACGGHIGNNHSIRATIQTAIEQKVVIGVHPSYPDQENFGRVVLDISDNLLEQSLIQQISEFCEILAKSDAVLHHIKPHGALYNEAAVNPKIADIVIRCIQKLNLQVPIYCQEGSVMASRIIEAGLNPVFEVFADRAYEDDLTLRSRKLNGAIINDEVDVLEHVKKMVLEDRVQTYSGLIKPISAQTICLHSDTAGSIELAKKIHNYLKENGVLIASA